MKHVASPKNVLSNQKGFTLIELIMVIVILGILAVVAIPKYVDMQKEAAVAAANGVYGAAEGAAAINFSAGLVGSTNVPVAAGISNGTTLALALDGGVPDGWFADTTGLCSNGTGTAPTACTGTTYLISVTTAEAPKTSKAVLAKNF